METTTVPATGFAVRIDTYDDPIELVLLLAQRAFLDGSQPMSRTTRLQRVRKDATLVPPNMVPSRQAVTDHGRAITAEGPGWTLVARVGTERTGWITVTAATDELAADVLAAATADAEDPPEPTPETVGIRFWHLGSRAPRRVDRSIVVPSWAEIRDNYETGAAAAVDGLMALDSAPTSGRLLLLHGPPGTGKTTILRALARSWKPWCRIDHVIDPERMFANAGYLLDVLADDDDDASRWKLLVLEDCDELIRAEAKTDTGQSLARLLNVTDGLIGQGVQVMVCITTNERLGRLHPAITRPGRCLAEIEVGPLPATQARAWLGRDLPAGTNRSTLAELFALRDDRVAVSTLAPEEATGAYL